LKKDTRTEGRLAFAGEVPVDFYRQGIGGLAAPGRGGAASRIQLLVTAATLASQAAECPEPVERDRLMAQAQALLEAADATSA
jgi:hypothetical protein